MSFPGFRADIRTCVRVTKLVEAKLAIKMKVKVVSVDEWTLERLFSYSRDPSRTWKDQKGTSSNNQIERQKVDLLCSMKGACYRNVLIICL